MSYDIHLEINTGGRYPARVEDIGNHTSNTNEMWQEALGIPLSSLHGYKAEAAITVLKKALDKMEKDPERFKKFNPKNGWGNFDSAYAYLKNLYKGCVEHPLTTIYISY